MGIHRGNCNEYCNCLGKYPQKIFYSKPAFSSQDQRLLFKTDYPLMHIKNIAPREHSAILSTCIKLPSVFKTFVFPIFEWQFKWFNNIQN